MDILSILLVGLGGYLVIGLAFALCFVTRPVARVDPIAATSGPVFRAMIVPGVAALWPLMLVKWVRASRGGEA